MQIDKDHNHYPNFCVTEVEKLIKHLKPLQIQSKINTFEDVIIAEINKRNKFE